MSTCESDDIRRQSEYCLFPLLDQAIWRFFQPMQMSNWKPYPDSQQINEPFHMALHRAK
jgi:hypothetical protein